MAINKRRITKLRAESAPKKKKNIRIPLKTKLNFSQCLPMYEKDSKQIDWEKLF